jgi:hypothetical protein
MFPDTISNYCYIYALYIVCKLKRFNNMKTLNFKLAAFILILVGFAAGCSKDSSKVSPFPGNYVITEATVAESFSIPVTGLGNIPVPVGTPITAAIQVALLGAVTCTSADLTYIELRADFSLYMSCQGENSLNAGTWSEVSSTELLLNLNGTAIPSSPTGIALNVTEVVKNGTVLTGKTSVPIPKAMIAELVKAISPTFTLDPSAPDITIVKFALKFTQK